MLRLTVHACLLSVAGLMPTIGRLDDASGQSAPAAAIPQEYVGTWTGIRGKATAHLKETTRGGLGVTNKDFGHIIDQFEFEVAADGGIKGTGKATYYFDVTADGNLIVTTVTAAAHLVGKTQQVDFTISGKMTADGKVTLTAAAKKDLVLDNAGKQGPMGAWNVFGGFQEQVATADGQISISANHAIPQIGMKLEWVARKVSVQPALTWNNQQGGLDLRFTVIDADITKDTPIEVHWASGQTYADRLGDPFFTHHVPPGTKVGAHGPIRITGTALRNAPAGTTHLVAATGELHLSPLQDVQIAFGADANQAAVSGTTLTAVREFLRAAGQNQATINSTARSPEDQARAMFDNLVRADMTIQQNITNQLALYAAPGDAVVNVFATQTNGQTRAQAVANRAAVEQAMIDEINNQGPSNVSRHCGDSNVLNVIDIGAGAFNATNGPLFTAAAQGDGRVSRFIDERASNNCYHLELPQAAAAPAPPPTP
jgi:hypothetical protein